MKIYKLGLLLLITAGAIAGASPWPFPWAKECPMDWGTMSGRYVLSDSSLHEEVDLVISVTEQKDKRLVKLSQYDSYGYLIAEGRALLKAQQNSIGMYLNSVHKSSPVTWAVIRLYYRTAIVSCGQDQIVPILTVQTPQETAHYRLVKVARDGR